MLNHDVFKDWVGKEGNGDYHIELYSLVSEVCLINVIHALTLISLSFYIVLLTRKFKILNESHYKQFVVLAIVITIVYLLPIAIITYRAYAGARDSSTAGHKGTVARFTDLLLYVIVKSDQGVGGFVLGVLIHF